MKRKAAVFLFSLCIIFVSSNVFAENMLPAKGDKYIGFTANIGMSGLMYKAADSNKSENIYLSAGFCYTDFYANWFSLDYLIKYKKYLLKDNGAFESYDYISPTASFNLHIKRFNLSFIFSYNFNLYRNNNQTNTLFGVGLGIGYLIFSNDKILIPIKLEFEYLLPSCSDSGTGILFGAYLKINILFKL